MTIYTEYNNDLFANRSEAEKLIRDRVEHSLLTTKAEKDGVILDQFSKLREVEINATPIFNSTSICGSFSIWSDNKIRRSVLVSVVSPERWIGTALEGQLSTRSVPICDACITNQAISFIQASLGSDSERPEWLGTVRNAVEGMPIATKLGHSHYAGVSITPYTLTFEDASVRTVWVYSVGYCEGYAFDIYESRGAAMAQINPKVNSAGPLECWECGAAYSEPGHVENGCMGCDRCNS
jgi:hypothetical protein